MLNPLILRQQIAQKMLQSHPVNVRPTAIILNILQQRIKRLTIVRQ
jgi:hypothetical protein